MPLSARHRWRVREGCSRLVLGRGAVGLDVPREWMLRPKVDSVEVLDSEPPEDDLRLEISHGSLPPGLDWRRAPVQQLAAEDRRELHARGPVRTHPVERREACSRLPVALGGFSYGVRAVLTCEFWPEDAGAMDPVWTTAIETLELGRVFTNPATRVPVDPGRN